MKNAALDKMWNSTSQFLISVRLDDCSR